MKIDNKLFDKMLDNALRYYEITGKEWDKGYYRALLDIVATFRKGD